MSESQGDSAGEDAVGNDGQLIDSIGVGGAVDSRDVGRREAASGDFGPIQVGDESVVPTNLQEWVGDLGEVGHGEGNAEIKAGALGGAIGHGLPHIGLDEGSEERVRIGVKAHSCLARCPRGVVENHLGPSIAQGIIGRNQPSTNGSGLEEGGAIKHLHGQAIGPVGGLKAEGVGVHHRDPIGLHQGQLLAIGVESEVGVQRRSGELSVAVGEPD